MYETGHFTTLWTYCGQSVTAYGYSVLHYNYSLKPNEHPVTPCVFLDFYFYFEHFFYISKYNVESITAVMSGFQTIYICTKVARQVTHVP